MSAVSEDDESEDNESDDENRMPVLNGQGLLVLEGCHLHNCHLRPTCKTHLGEGHMHWTLFVGQALVRLTSGMHEESAVSDCSGSAKLKTHKSLTLNTLW